MSAQNDTHTNIWRALGFWTIAIQYLDLSEKTSKKIHESGNEWIVVSRGSNWEKQDAEYKERTAWSDHNLGIPVIFNFYHGLELTLKGIIIAKGIDMKNHKLNALLDAVDEINYTDKIVSLIRPYVFDEFLPTILKEFLQESNISISNWYQALKYPESNKGEIYNHHSLKYREKDGANFFKKLSEDIHEIRLELVSYVGVNYPEII